MSSDDFFSTFGEKTAGISHRAVGPPPGAPPPNNNNNPSGRGPPPRPARAAPPPARPPPQQQSRTATTAAPPAAPAAATAAPGAVAQRRLAQQQRRPVAPPPPNQNSYVLNSNATSTSRTTMSNGSGSGRGSNHGMPPPVAPAPQQQSYYAHPPSQQQQQQQTPSPPQFQQNYENNNDDWYSPTASETMQMSSPFDSNSSNSNINNYGTHTQYTAQSTAVAAAAPAYNNNNNASSFSSSHAPQQQPAAAPFLQGSMDLSGRSTGSTGSAAARMMHTFIPNAQQQPHSLKQAPGDLDDLDNEPPLLEELGINIEHIMLKTKAVVVPFRRFHKGNSALTDPELIMEDADLAGPLILALLLGGELLMAGKMQFGYIYGLSVFGCLAMTLILNLMSPEKPISFWTVTSILGYALLPVNLLAAVKLLFIFYLQGVTKALAVVAVLWSTTASTRLLELGCGLQAQRYLLAYPIALLYSAFVLITIF